MNTEEAQRDTQHPPPPVVDSRVPNPSRWWPLAFGLLGFVIGCEVHVQRFLFGVPATPILLLIAGGTIGATLGRLRPGQPVGSVARWVGLVCLFVVVLSAFLGVAIFFTGWFGWHPARQSDPHKNLEDRRQSHIAVDAKRPELLSPLRLGFSREFAEGAVDERWKLLEKVIVVRQEGKIFALRSFCTCCEQVAVNWLEPEQKFKCPHCGSGYLKDGANFEGPAAPSSSPLARYAVSQATDGQLQLDPNYILRKEQGQWGPRSYLIVPPPQGDPAMDRAPEGRQYEYTVVLDLIELEERGLKLPDLLPALVMYQVTRVTQDAAVAQLVVRNAPGQSSDSAALENTVMTTVQGRPVRLRDLGFVKERNPVMEIKSDKALEQWLSQLASPNAEEREDAAHELGRRLGSRRTPPSFKDSLTPHEKETVVSRLLEALQDQDRFVRWQAAASLGNFDSPDKRVLAGLKTAAKDSEPRVRVAAHGALWRITNEEVFLSPLLEALKDKSADVRLDAVGALRLGADHKKAIAPLIPVLKDPDGEVRTQAEHFFMRLCGVLGGEAREAVPALIENFRNNADSHSRYSMASALGGIGREAKTAIPVLIQDLQTAPRDLESDRRGTTAWALGKIGSDGKTVIPVLAEALSDKSESLRREAAYALGTIGAEAKSLPRHCSRPQKTRMRTFGWRRDWPCGARPGMKNKSAWR